MATTSLQVLTSQLVRYPHGPHTGDALRDGAADGPPTGDAPRDGAADGPPTGDALRDGVVDDAPHDGSNDSAGAVVRPKVQQQSPPVINELLCFIQNKMDSMPRDILVKLCLDFYSEDKVTEAKRIAFELIQPPNLRYRRRRGQNKSREDLNEMVQILLQEQPDRKTVFVANDLSQIPPVSMKNFDILKLVSDIEVVKQSVQMLTNSQSDTNTLLHKHIELQSRNQDTFQRQEEPLQPLRLRDGPQECATASIDGDDLSTTGATTDTSAVQIDPAGISAMHKDIPPATDGSGCANHEHHQQDNRDLAKLDNEDSYDFAELNLQNRFEILSEASMTGDDDSLYVPDYSSRKRIHRSNDAHCSTPKVSKIDVIIGHGQNKHSVIPKQSLTNQFIIGKGPGTSVQAHSQRQKTHVAKDSDIKPVTGIFVSRFKPHMTSSQVDNYVRLHFGVHVRSEKLQTRYKSYSSFYIRADRKLRELFLKAQAESIWSSGLLVKPYS